MPPTTLSDEGPGLDHRSLPELAADAIVELIFRDGLGEGDALPSSGDLAQRFDVGPAVIREALAILAARGLVSRRQGREPTVAVPSDEVIATSLHLLARHHGMSLADFQETRTGIEVQAAALAARRGEPDAKSARLEPCLDRMRTARSDEDFVRGDLLFHLVLAELSENRATCVILSALHQLVSEVMEVTLRRVRSRSGADGAHEIVVAHARIADRVIAGDAEAASEAMMDHFALGESVEWVPATVGRSTEV